MLLPKMQYLKHPCYPRGKGHREEGGTQIAVASSGQIASLSVKAYGKSAQDFIVFWQQEHA